MFMNSFYHNYLEHCRRNMSVLKDLGLLSDEVIAQTKDSAGSVEIAVEFSDLATAEKAFLSVAKSGIVDIYLYDHGQIHMKHD